MNACIRMLALFFSLTTCAVTVANADAIGAGNDWTRRNADTSETAYSRLDQINSKSIRGLGLAWSFDLPGEGSLEATPLAIGGVLYFTGTRSTVYAVDGGTGKQLWKFDPETWKVAPETMGFFQNNRGVAYADGRIFSAAHDGRLFAIDAKSGQLIWTAKTTSNSKTFISGAPRIFKGKVLIGNSGASLGYRGYISAYDARSGKQLWRFYTAPGSPDENRGDPAMERAAQTWTGTYWENGTGTGGGPWEGITVDAELNRVYVGTGTAGPQNPDVRSPGRGDNLYTASIVALDADTGKYVWHYQVVPRDGWDFDNTAQMTLADLTIEGQRRKVLMQAPKSGFFYVIDRLTGKVISAEKLGKVTWAERIDLKTGAPVILPSARWEKTGSAEIWPWLGGAHNWMSMAFSPKTGLIYVPYMQLGSAYKFKKASEGVGGVLSITDLKADAMDGKGALIAWDPVKQQPAWKVQLDTLWNGGAMTTAGDLVFQGAADGFLSAYDATSGESLWRFYTAMGINAAPMTYLVNGKQQISVLVGFGGSGQGDSRAGWRYRSPRRLLTFTLGGKEELGPSPPRDMTVHAVDDPSLKLDPAAVEAGRGLFRACGVCHRGGSSAPDLIESQIALHPESFWSVLNSGALVSMGMPKFPALTREQAMQIWAYIRSTAREERPGNSTEAPAR